MKKLNHTSLYDNVHFLAFGVIFFILTLKYWWFIFLLIIYLIFIYRKTELFYLLLSLFILIGISYLQYLPKEMPYEFKGIVTKTTEYSCEVLTSKGKIQVFGEHDLSLGDYTYFKTSDYHYKSDFKNYEEYLKNNGILASRKLKTAEVIKNYFLIASIQETLSKLVEDNHPKTGKYLTTLLIGDNNLENEINNNLEKLGVSHLLAISGLHINILVGLFVWFLDKILYFEKPKEIIVMFFLFFYIIITNFSLSVLRAAMMVILKYYFKRKKYLFTKLDCLSFITLGVLIFSPKKLFLVSFELSYLISFIMITFIPMLKKQHPITNAIKIGIIAFMTGLPIVININYEINLLSIIVSPLFSFYFELLLIPLSVIILFFPFLEGYCVFFFELFENSLAFFAEIDSFNLVFGRLSSIEVLIYYVIVFSLFFFFYNKRRKNIIMMFFLLYLAIIYFKPYFNPFAVVTFYDVGQGDSILISLPHGKGNILVDCYQNIVSLMKEDGIKKIDYLIISHGHTDHMNAIDDVLKTYNVKKLYTSQYDNSGLLDLDYNFTLLESGDIIQLETLNLDVLSPIKKASNENDNSLVIRFEIEGISYLLTGDIEGDGEALLVQKYYYKLQSDILKVAHHGSNTSSSDLFLKYVNPNYYVISVGYQNIYNLPDHEKLLNYDNLYRTDLDGTISFYQKKGQVFIKKDNKNN